MNYSEIKNISIVDFLHTKGIEPINKNAQYYQYSAPERVDKNPSLTVYHKSNTWYDFGSDMGGDIGKLVQYYYNIDAADALKLLNEFASNNNISSYVHFAGNIDKKTRAEESLIQIVEIREIAHWHLKNYLAERNIPLLLAQQYVKEVEYIVRGRAIPFHSLAFRNDRGGYVLRHKGQRKPIASKPAGYTTVEVTGSIQLNIFEGFFDFLSALVYYEQVLPSYTTIILNSVSHLGKALHLLNNYERINIYLDNDETGISKAEMIAATHPGVKNHSELYKGYKDFNEFLQSK